MGNDTNSSNGESDESDPIELIRKLKQLNDEGLITNAEFEEKRQKLLDSL
ncbi:SHOCT domain-containing protein [Halorubrum lacusprofundi]